MIIDDIAWPAPLPVEELRKHLYNRWEMTCVAWEVQPEVAVPLFEALWRCHQEPHRRYHTAQHLRDIFFFLDRSEMGSGISDLCAWFHDVVYDTWSQAANEAASAAWADRAMLAMGLSNGAREQVRNSILETQHHPRTMTAGHNHDIFAFFDADMAILGADRRRFAQYEAQVRDEYKEVPDGVFWRNRRAFLQEALGLPFLFHTKWFRDRFQAPANRNLASSLEVIELRLSGGDNPQMM